MALVAGEASSYPEPNLVRERGCWSLTFRGQLIRLKDAKGLYDLARLLAYPHRRFHVLELWWGREGENPPDWLGVAEHRLCLDQLEAELAEARRSEDRGYEELVQQELCFVREDLMSCCRVGPGSLRETCPSDRARKAVTKRMRDEIRRLLCLKPDLGRHLERSIQTGTFCCYRPEDSCVWTVVLH